MSPEDFMQSVQRKMYLSNDPRFKEFLDSYGAFDWGSSEDYNRSALIGDSQGQYGEGVRGEFGSPIYGNADYSSSGRPQGVMSPTTQFDDPRFKEFQESFSKRFDWDFSEDYNRVSHIGANQAEYGEQVRGEFGVPIFAYPERTASRGYDEIDPISTYGASRMSTSQQYPSEIRNFSAPNYRQANNFEALPTAQQGQYGRVSDEDGMGLGEPIALPNRQSATPTNEREWEQISGNPKFNDFDWGSSQDYLSYSKRGGERDIQPMTSSQNLATNQEIKDAGEEIDGSQYSGAEGAVGEGTNYSGIGGAIKDSAEAISDGLDSLGNFKRNLMTGGLSILSSIIPDTPRKLRAERRAVGGDSYGRRQYNNMFKDGGTLTRAERYLQKNYKKLDGNKDRKEFLESLINLKTK